MLYQGLVDNNKETIASELSILFNDLPPKISSTDPWGHKENFNTLIEQLNRHDQFTAELECYCCLESNPPQSVVHITIDSTGTEIVRRLNILTPNDDYLRCLSVY